MNVLLPVEMFSAIKYMFKVNNNDNVLNSRTRSKLK